MKREKDEVFQILAKGNSRSGCEIRPKSRRLKSRNGSVFHSSTVMVVYSRHTSGRSNEISRLRSRNLVPWFHRWFMGNSGCRWRTSRRWTPRIANSAIHLFFTNPCVTFHFLTLFLLHISNHYPD